MSFQTAQTEHLRQYPAHPLVPPWPKRCLAGSLILVIAAFAACGPKPEQAAGGAAATFTPTTQPEPVPRLRQDDRTVDPAFEPVAPSPQRDRAIARGPQSDRAIARPTQTQPAAIAAAEPPHRVPAQPPPIIGLQGNDLLALIDATILTENGTPIPCRIVPEQTTTQPTGRRASFRLIPDDPRQPVCRCEITESDRETTLAAYSPGPPVWLTLTAETLAPMLPVCLAPRENDRFMNAALGPVHGEWFDGLFAPERDWAVAMEGSVYCQELPDRVRLTISPDESQPSWGTILTLRAEPDFLKTTHNLTGYAPLHRRRPELMPAAWMPLDTGRAPSPDDIARNTVWMAINLQPYGAASVLLPGMQSMLPAVRTSAVPSPSSLRSPGAPSGPSTTGISAWECFQQTAAGLVARFWGHGLIAQSMSSTLLVGDPLTPQQARLYVSLLGLAGESPIACERMYTLSDERVELLRRIIPAAPVRAVDLFPHPALPPVWNLSIANGAGSFNVLGLFNTSDEPRTEWVELADLHLGTGTEQFAVYDVWERRLLRIVRDRFQLRVPATGCQVVSINRLAEDRPTLIGTDRHITCGGIDLHDVRWDDQTLSLSGQGDVVANDPYELLLHLPEGPDSVELDRVECRTCDTETRAHGPLRVVTLQSAISGPVEWRLEFRRAGQSPQPAPPRPRNLAARQNTRGVLLSWYQPDDRAVAHRLYRNQRFLAEVDGCEYQDSAALYNAEYEYTVSAVNFCGQESVSSDPLFHVTPVPASTNLTQLVPLSSSQDRLAPGRDKSAAGTPMRIGRQRIYRGLGVTAPSRIVYFLGGGYDVFTGSVGIDDAAEGRGSAIFRIIADGQTLFTSPVIKGGEPALPFTTRVAGKLQLELIVTDAGDGPEGDFADWANVYLRAAQPVPAEPRLSPLESAAPLEPPPESDQAGFFPDSPATRTAN